MVALNYGLSEDLEATFSRARDNFVEPPAATFLHDDKLNMGPAILFAGVLSVLCWGGIIGGLYLMFH